MATTWADTFDINNPIHLYALGVDVLTEAQRLAPEGSGFLKQSASLIYDKKLKGVAIIYKAPYAYTLHEGFSEQELLNPANLNSQKQYVSLVPQHRRQIKGGSVTVREHTKTYQRGYKPVKVGNIWKTKLYSTEPSRKKGWLQQAYQNIRKKLPLQIRRILPEEMIITLDTEIPIAENRRT